MKMFTKNEPMRQGEPQLKRIPIDELEFAPYQREVKAAKVKKIVKNFMPDIVGIGLVSFRKGKYWCLDAQHRVRAMKELGYKEIWCQVLTGLTYEEECLRFTILNTGRTQLTANQVFHSRVEGRDPEALALVSAFAKYRYTYNKNEGGKSENCIGAVSKFVKMQKMYGIEMVERVLCILRNAWFGDKTSLSSAIITGVATFFAENPNANDITLIKALEKVSPDNLLLEANMYVGGSKLRPGRADNACYHVAKIISQMYEDEINKPRRGRRKIEAV